MRRHASELETAEIAMAVETQQSHCNAVDSEVRGPTTGVQRRCLLGTTGRQAQSEQARGPGGAATAAA